MDGWNTSFLLGTPIFRDHISFRESTNHNINITPSTIHPMFPSLYMDFCRSSTNQKTTAWKSPSRYSRRRFSATLKLVCVDLLRKEREGKRLQGNQEGEGFPMMVFNGDGSHLWIDEWWFSPLEHIPPLKKEKPSFINPRNLQRSDPLNGVPEKT